MAKRKIHKRSSKRKPPRNYVTLLSVFLVGVALVSLVVGLAHRIVQTQKRLETLQSKLLKVSEEAIQAEARNAESQQLAVDLRRDLERARQSSRTAEAHAAAVSKQVADTKVELDQLVTNRVLLQRELGVARTELTRLRSQLHTAKSQDAEMQLRLKAVKRDLEASLQATLKAKTRAIELGEQTIYLQSELKMSKSELAELRKKLNQVQVLLEAQPPLSKRRYTNLQDESEARDYLIRTIVFEGDGETEMAKAALVHVILNRQSTGKWGDKIKDVVMRPWQFEPWMTRRGEIENLSLEDPRYRDAAEIVDSVLAGRIPDPTAGATYFLNPVIVRQRRGGSLPLWAADSEGRPIGRHVFYSPDDVPHRAGSRWPKPVKVP